MAYPCGELPGLALRSAAPFPVHHSQLNAQVFSVIVNVSGHAMTAAAAAQSISNLYGAFWPSVVSVTIAIHVPEYTYVEQRNNTQAFTASQ